MERRSRTHCQARIRVVGVGGGGVSAVNRLVDSGIFGVDFITVDSDSDAKQNSRAPLHICIGDDHLNKYGLNGSVEGGRRAAEGAVEVLFDVLSGSDLVFVISGLGGGTGTGAAPAVAEVAKRLNAVVVGIVTTPFNFEGEKRTAAAETGVKLLKGCTDTLIVVPNDRVLEMAGGAIGFHETYRLAHDIWHQSVQGISDLVNRSGLINVDFADVRSIMSEGGGAVIATGKGRGHDRARDAALRATRSNLLGITLDGARGLLFNVVGGSDLNLLEVEEAAAVITRRADPEANVIIGASINEAMGDEVCITVVATGFAVPGQKPGLIRRDSLPLKQAAMPVLAPALISH